MAVAREAIPGEAEPNVETVVISDLNLVTIARERDFGSVRPLYDRRPDLYDLEAKIPIRIVRA